MYEQLVEIMPELARVVPWNVVGQRRRLYELGVCAQRGFSAELFIDRGEWSMG
jgi:hypothetical protein